MAELRFGWSQTQGRREYQQDGVTTSLWPNGFGLFVLSDGMGGAVDGDKACQIILSTFNSAFNDDTEDDIGCRLTNSTCSANDALLEYVEQHPNSAGMGGTLIGVGTDGSQLSWVSVGDSPLWLFRDGKLRRLNQDHSKKAEMLELVENGQMTMDEIKVHPQRNVITSALMGRPIPLLDDNNIITLHDDDIILLASDGVETLELEELEAILNRFHEMSPEDLSNYIIDVVESKGLSHQDNASVLIVKV